MAGYMLLHVTAQGRKRRKVSRLGRTSALLLQDSPELGEEAVIFGEV